MTAEEIFTALLGPAGRDDPYPLYAELHKLGDVAAAGPGVVVVAGYDAINAVLRDPAYVVQDAAMLDETFPDWREHPSMSMDSILNLNPPEHAPMRSIVTRAFTARRVAGLKPAIERMTDDLLDAMAKHGAEAGQVEFMHEFAFQLPAMVICELIGIPDADRERFRPIGRDLTAMLEFGASDETFTRANAGARWLDHYFAGLAERRRGEPADDLITALVEISAAEDSRLTAKALLANLTLLLVAGFETTTNLLGNGLRILLGDPQLARAVRDETVPVSSVAEEVLRYDPPVQVTTRSRRDRGLIGDVPVQPGDEVVLLLGAGNRDGRRFRDPDTFDPRRAVGGPLSFGAGAHFCAGAALARLEAAVAFPRLLARFPGLALAGEPRRRDGFAFRGFDALPVTIG